MRVLVTGALGQVGRELLEAFPAANTSTEVIGVDLGDFDIGDRDEVLAAVGTDAPVVGAPYGSDLRLYQGAGVPTVQYGPGTIRHAHAVDEQVPVEEVVACAEAYLRLIIARCR